LSSTRKDRHTTQGYALAVAEVLRYEGSWSTVVRELVRAYGLTLQKMCEAGVHEHDMEEFMKAARSSETARQDLEVKLAEATAEPRVG